MTETLLDLDLPLVDAPSDWHAIADAPRNGTHVCLWIEYGDGEGYELRNCHWDAARQPADWWSAREGRAPSMAVPIGQHAALWRLDDGSPARVPPAALRLEFDVEHPGTWPDGYRDRLRAHRVGFADATLPFDLFEDRPRV